MAEDAPAIDPEWDWIWEAWVRLDAGDRPWLVEGVTTPLGGTIIRSAPGQIPWTAMHRWAGARGISDDDEALLDHCIQVLDVDYRKWWAEANRVSDGQ